MKQQTLTLLAVLFASCGSEYRTKYVCNCEQQKAVADFVSKNVGPANNKSDEEMEDVIIQLQRTGIATHCQAQPVWYNHNGGIDWEKEKIDSCRLIMY